MTPDPVYAEIHRQRMETPGYGDAEFAERTYLARDFSTWHPRPRDLPVWRRTMIPCWEPGGPFYALTMALQQQYKRGHDFAPLWEHRTLVDAELWFVGTEMCDLLVAAAPSMPDRPLETAEMPHATGLVVFQSALEGLDAEDSGVPVTVGAYLWGPGTWQGRDVLAITAYGPHIFPGSPLESPWLHPLGGLIWPIGENADCDMTGDPATDASMAEDRRRLRALWTISAQPDITRNERHEPVVRNRKKAKRIMQGRAERPEAIRVIYLRHQVNRPKGERAGRTMQYRSVTSGHWRNQAYGPGWSLRRPKYINPYLRGPENAPFLTGEKVKAWIR